MRIGRYADAVRANQQAHIVDMMAEQGKAVATYAGHNLRMLWYAAWMDGQSAIAIQAARDVAREGDWAASDHHQALARFGRWDELKQMNKAPSGKQQKAVWLFARGMAFLREGPRAKADKSLRRLTKIMTAADPEDGPIHQMRIAHGILAGEMAAADGDFDTAIEHLERAVETADHLEYSEPERWAIPPRQVLGAVLLQAGRPAEAQKRYEEELAKRRENGWSLYGLAETLRAQARKEEAAEVDERFRRAWARSDVFLTSSRF
jgi:tetratricopeptide (TPR) repeat protein